MQPYNDIQAQFAAWEKSHFRTKHINHSKAVHEMMATITWVTVGPSACSYLTDAIPGVEFYTNKLANEFRGKDENQMKWVYGLIGALKLLPDYVNDFHKQGLSWNVRAPKAPGIQAMKGGFGPGGGAVPAAASPAPAAAAAPKPAAPAAAAKPGLAIPVKAAPKKEPKAAKVRDGVYSVEYFEGSNPTMPAGLVHSDIVNIFGCKNNTVNVPVKVKAVTAQGCERMTLVVTDVIGMLELTSSKRLTVFITGKVQSVTVDKCDGVQINLSEDSLHCEITCAQSQGVNVDIPDPKEEGNMIEFPVPEQIRVQVDANRKLTHRVFLHE